jgi:hypothetical protein
MAEKPQLAHREGGINRVAAGDTRGGLDRR